MSLEIQKYQKKPFVVDAIQVTDDNMAEVAQWCQGEICSNESDGSYIFVRVHNPMNERQTKAFAGDWVLYAGRGYKVYRDRAMKSTFELVPELEEEEEAAAA